MVKVKVRIEHQLFHAADDMKLGPVAKKGDILDVIRVIKKKIGRDTKPYFIVVINGQEYTSWPPHCEKV